MHTLYRVDESVLTTKPTVAAAVRRVDAANRATDTALAAAARRANEIADESTCAVDALIDAVAAVLRNATVAPPEQRLAHITEEAEALGYRLIPNDAISTIIEKLGATAVPAVA
ncbi:hypothetical protein WKW80_05230 [Variovorax humicola]|uniref:Uncharacterized protein n=1 Tax=Variovorax humicola TaxID=1769758 RepID=A0ABU8VUF6_9BURK